MSADQDHKRMIDRIERFYLNGHELDEKDREICTRLESAYALLCVHRIKKVALDKHVKTSGVSFSTARSDMITAEKIFAPLSKYTKEFIRLIVIETSLKTLKTCKKKELAATSISQWEKVMNIADKAQKRMIEASGLHLDDPNQIDPEKFQQHVIQTTSPEPFKRMIKKLTLTGTADLSEIYDKISEEANVID